MTEQVPPAPTIVDAAALRERMESSRVRIAEAQSRAQQAKADLQGQTTTATSPDRAVTVSVNAGGVLTDLTFAAAANKVPLASLARTVLATYRQATAESAIRTEALMREVVGDGSPLLDLVRSGIAESNQEQGS
jgi:DNA-binding protein YbaB